jgi:hypothetical protein
MKCVQWIHLLQNAYHWRSFVNTVINLGISSLSERLSASQEGLCSTELVMLDIEKRVKTGELTEF